MRTLIGNAVFNLIGGDGPAGGGDGGHAHVTSALVDITGSFNMDGGEAGGLAGSVTFEGANIVNWTVGPMGAIVVVLP
ncbi:MAG: hypothetical protein ACYTGZ_03125 [Planctomycetota bacterium]|jgi:hypothetical protein